MGTPEKKHHMLQNLLDRLTDPERLRKQPLELVEIKFLIRSTKKVLMHQPTTLLRINAPIKICGDTHGQYRDVLRLLDRNGYPPQVSYLFLGDYVDRGSRSIEVICLMFAMTLTYPRAFFILRGNHETRNINRFYGFHAECCRRFDESIWEDFNQCFDYLPLAALVSERIFCMHGGIPRKLNNFKEIDDLKSGFPIQQEGGNNLISDLLWSDPSANAKGFVPNLRGQGCLFGRKDVTDFCERLDIDLVVRAHQVFRTGIDIFSDHLITVFSAPNYGGQFQNSAGCITVTARLMLQFTVLEPDINLPTTSKKATPPSNSAINAKTGKSPAAK